MHFREEWFGKLQKWTLEDHPFPFNVMFHKIVADPDSNPHDHPFAFNTFILEGSYTEEIFNLDYGTSELRTHRARDSVFIESGHVHRIIHCEEPTITMILPNDIDRTWSHFAFMDTGYRRHTHDNSVLPYFTPYKVLPSNKLLLPYYYYSYNSSIKGKTK